MAFRLFGAHPLQPFPFNLAASGLCATATRDKRFDVQALVLSPEQEDGLGSRGEGRIAWERGNGEMLVFVQRVVSLPGEHW